MRGNRYFWSLILILVGVLLLLSNLGLISVNIWPLLWPGFLILVGLWILSGWFFRADSVGQESLTIPLEGAQEGKVLVSHGAGRITMSGEAGTGQLLSGRFGGGIEYSTSRSGVTVEVDLRAEVDRWFGFGFPWTWGRGSGLEWDFSLSGEIPVSLEVRTGASELRLDLSQLRLKEFKLETGASSADIVLPARAGMTRVLVKGGATSVTIRVPQAVAARITSEAGLGELKVDTARFPRTADGYESSEYAASDNKVDIRAEVGLSSVSIT